MNVQLLDQDGSRHRPETVRRHIVVRVAHPAQRCSHGVLAHRAFAREQARKHVPTVPGDRMRLAQNLHGAIGQWDKVRSATEFSLDRAFHLGRRNTPGPSIKIDFGLLHPANASGTLKQQRRQLKRRPRQRLSAVRGNRAHQGAHSRGLGHLRSTYDGEIFLDVFGHPGTSNWPARRDSNPRHPT